MKNKKVVVALKYYKGELNPFDGAALEAALEAGFTDVTAVAMAPSSVLPSLKSLTRLGIKAILVSDPIYAGSDTIATSYILAEVMRSLAPDLIFCGRQSIDGDTAQVPPMLAERLGYALSNKVIDLTPSGDFITRGGETVDLGEKKVVTFERMRTLRFPSMFSRPSDVRVIDNSELMLDRAYVGLCGSPTRVIKAYESTVGRRACKFIDKGELSATILEALKREKKETVAESGEKLCEVFYLGNLSELAKSLSNTATEVQYEGRDAQQIADHLKKCKASVVLFEGQFPL